MKVADQRNPCVKNEGNLQFCVKNVGWIRDIYGGCTEYMVDE